MFVSLVPSPPAFLIPVFLVPGGNQACVQDLDGASKILRFEPFDADAFFAVPLLPPQVERFVGDDGIIAFWRDETNIIVGTRNELKSKLSDVNDLELPAFVAVEALSLVGDQSRLTAAIERAEARLGGRSGKSVYKERVLNRAAILAALEQQVTETSGPIENGIEKIIDYLHGDMPATQWFDLWHEAWRDHIGNERLFEIAKWRIENFDCDVIEGNIVYQLALHNNSSQQTRFSLDWLASRGRHYALWTSISRLLIERHGVQLESASVAIEIMEQKNRNNEVINYSWIVLWSLLWRIRDKNFSKKLIEIARSSKKVPANRDDYVRHVIVPILDDGGADWAQIELASWLSKPRSEIFWVEQYIQNWPRLRSEDYIASGARWLRRYGRGMNIWEPLWMLLKDVIGPKEASDLAEYWLLGARKDLNSWPRVFAEVLQMRSQPSDMLRRAAVQWVRSSSGTKKNELIESVALA